MKFLLISTIFFLAACQGSSSEINQLSSKSNRDGSMIATWTETGAGATTRFVYRLHINNPSRQHQFDESTEILRTSSIVDTGITWISDSTLLVNCLRGDVYFWNNRYISGSGEVRIELHSSCPEKEQDQWIYIAPGTPAHDIPPAVVKDHRIQELLNDNREAIREDTSARVLYNAERVKEIIQSTNP